MGILFGGERVRLRIGAHVLLPTPAEAGPILGRVVDALDRGQLTALEIDQCDDVDPHFNMMHALAFVREAGYSNVTSSRRRARLAEELGRQKLLARSSVRQLRVVRRRSRRRSGGQAMCPAGRRHRMSHWVPPPPTDFIQDAPERTRRPVIVNGREAPSNAVKARRCGQ
jgi:hypothetical protein